MEIHIVDSCVRDGQGGSPTGVVLNDAFETDTERMGMAAELGVSHVGFVAPRSTADDVAVVRFFTSTGELVGCGHGTVAVHAVLHDAPLGTEVIRQQLTGGRTFPVRSTRTTHGVMCSFDQGLVTLAPAVECHAFPEVLAALGLTLVDLDGVSGPVVASPGAPRLLLPVGSDQTLWAIRPDQPRLVEASRAGGLLGCFVYAPVAPVTPGDVGMARTSARTTARTTARTSARTTARTSARTSARMSARMFAPAIGVPEDIANANSTGCLAAHLASTGLARRVSVDQGDAFDRPSTILAEASLTPYGWTTSVGGVAVLRRGNRPNRPEAIG